MVSRDGHFEESECSPLIERNGSDNKYSLDWSGHDIGLDNKVQEKNIFEMQNCRNYDVQDDRQAGHPTQMPRIRTFKKTCRGGETTFRKREMSSEIRFLCENIAWALLPQPSSRNVILSKWLYRDKEE